MAFHELILLLFKTSKLAQSIRLSVMFCLHTLEQLTEDMVKQILFI